MLKNTDNVVNAVRYAVRTRAYWVTFVTENNVTRDMIADVSKEIAALAYPSDEPVQKTDGKRTRYGNAVQAAAAMLRKVIEPDTDETPATPDYLALAVAAAKTAHDKGEVANDDILKAIKAALA